MPVIFILLFNKVWGKKNKDIIKLDSIKKNVFYFDISYPDVRLMYYFLNIF